MNNHFDRSVVKERAKAALKKCYWMAVGVAAIVGLIVGELAVGNFNIDLSGLTSGEAEGFTADAPFIQQPPEIDGGEFLPMLAVAFAALFLFIFVLVLAAVFVKAYFLDGVMRVGRSKFFLGVTRGDAKFGDAFMGFGKSYRNISRVLFARFIRLFLWELIPLIPLSTVALGAGLEAGGFEFAGMMIFFVSILAVLPAMVPSLIKNYEYSLIPYLLAEYPDMSKEEAFAASKKLTDGYKGELFVLDLSFIGWQLLGVLTFGVGLVFLEPYIRASWAESYAEICRLKNPPAPTPFAPIVPPAPFEPFTPAAEAPVEECAPAIEPSIDEGELPQTEEEHEENC